MTDGEQEKQEQAPSDDALSERMRMWLDTLSPLSGALSEESIADPLLDKYEPPAMAATSVHLEKFLYAVSLVKRGTITGAIAGAGIAILATGVAVVTAPAILGVAAVGAAAVSVATVGVTAVGALAGGVVAMGAAMGAKVGSSGNALSREDYIDFDSVCMLIYKEAYGRLGDSSKNLYAHSMDSRIILLILRKIYKGEFVFYFKPQNYDAENFDIKDLIEINFKSCYKSFTDSIKNSNIEFNTFNILSDSTIYENMKAETIITQYGEVLSEKLFGAPNFLSYSHILWSKDYTPYSLFELEDMPDINSAKNTQSIDLSSNRRLSFMTLKPMVQPEIEKISNTSSSFELKVEHFKHNNKIFSLCNHDDILYDNKFNLYRDTFKIAYKKFCTDSAYFESFNVANHFHMFLFCNGINIAQKGQSNFLNIPTGNTFFSKQSDTAQDSGFDFFFKNTLFLKEEIINFKNALSEEDILEYFEKPYASFQKDANLSIPSGTDSLGEINEKWGCYEQSGNPKPPDFSLYWQAVLALNAHDKSHSTFAIL